MGQYHAIACPDTGEALYSHPMGQGLKLMEQGSGGYGGTTTGLAMLIAPGGRWHGNRIVVVGDYAEQGDIPDGVPFADDPGSLYNAMDRDGGGATSYAQAICGEAFGIEYPTEGGWVDTKIDHVRMARLSADTADDGTFGPLYVVDLDTNQFLDPMAFGCGRNLPAIALRQCGVMLATVVLLAVSNGRGGGDIHSDNPLVGSWGCHRIVLGERPEAGTDISSLMRSLLVDAGEYSPEWSGSWDEPGSLPSWLAKEVGVQ